MTRRRADEASVLMLMPAAVLIVLVLAALAIDLSLVFLRQRQASATAADIANDLATAALDVDALRATGAYELDAARAQDLGEQLANESDVSDELVSVNIEVVGDDEVRVEVTLSVDYIFAKAIPGTEDGTQVHAAATARAVEDSEAQG
jgi:Flp pilus assembly protein TadG